MKIKKHIGGLIGAIFILIIVIAYLTMSTKVVAFAGDDSITVNEKPMIYNYVTFLKVGKAPVYIDSIRFVGEEIPDGSKVYVFFPKKNCQLDAGMTTKEEFIEQYGDNLLQFEEIKWPKDICFDTVLLTKSQNKIDNIKVEITYKIFGVFKKKIVSPELSF